MSSLQVIVAEPRVDGTWTLKMNGDVLVDEVPAELITAMDRVMNEPRMRKVWEELGYSFVMSDPELEDV